MFEGWRNQPIVEQIPGMFKQYETSPGIFHISSTSPEYRPLCNFAADMLGQLPFSNEVGKTFLMRPDANLVTQELIKVLRGQQGWSQIAWVFTRYLELFKNEVFRSHGLSSAICYNVDLSTDNKILIERIHVENSPDHFTGRYDSRLTASAHEVLLSAVSFTISNLDG